MARTFSRPLRAVSIIVLGVLAILLVPIQSAFAVHSVTSVTPSSLGRGATSQDVVVHGANFLPGATVSFSPSTGITINTTTVNDTSTITVNVTISSTATTGAHNVTVTNPVEGNASCTSCFTINVAPIPTTASPSSLGRGATSITTTITGSGFVAGATVSVSGTGVTAGTATVSSATSLTVPLTVASDATTGFRNITVTNTDHGTASCGSCLTINAAPVATTLTPSSGANSGTTQVTITGTGFVSGVTATLKKASQSDVAGTVQFISATSIKATFDLNLAAPGTWDLLLTNLDHGTSTCAACFTVAGNTPTVTDVSPDTLGRGATAVDVVLTGTNFAHGATVTVSGTGVTAGTAVVSSSTSLTVPITVSSSATISARDVTVTNTDSLAGVCSGCLTIEAGPTVTSVDPSALGQGATSQDFTITGTGFVDGATVTISGAGVTLGTISVDSSTSISTTITVSASATVSARNVTVTNPDLGSGTCTNCFTVHAAPTVTSLNPASVGQGVSNKNITVTGTGFVDTPDIAISGSGVTVNTVTFNSATSLTINVTIAGGAATGARDVTVTNPDLGTSTCTGCLTIDASPSIDQATPSALGQGASAQIVDVKGTGFVNGSAVTISGTGVTVNSTTFVSASHLDVSFTVGSSATTGARTLTVTNPDGGIGSCAICFSINAKPSITPPPSPASLGQGATNVTVSLGGSGFVNGVAVGISGSGVTVGTVTVVDGTHMTVVLSVATNAATGTRDITLTNADHGTSVCSGCLTIATGPTVTSGSPAAGSNNGSVTVTITGTGFVDGATAALQRSGQDDIVGTNVQFVNATTLKADFDLTLAAPGSWDISVTNPDFGTGVCSGCFSIAASAPTVASATPSSLGLGASNVDVVLAGTHFANGAIVSVSGSGVTVGTVTVDSDTSITVVLSVSPAAATGSRDITVSNTDGQSGTCTGCLSLVVGPTVTSVSPATAGQGATGRAITITGTGFAAGAAVSFSGTGITVGAVTVNSSTSISTTVDIDPGAATGLRDVTVTNTNHGAGTCTCFTITVAPAASSAAPADAGQGAVGRQVVITGTGFQSGATASFSGSGITVTSHSTTGSTTLTLTIDVTSGATTGKRSITVVNLDGGTSTCTDCFTIDVGPSVTDASPANGGQGATGHAVTINGSDFVDTPTVSFSGSGIAVTDVSFTDDATLDITIDIGSSAATGARDITITNADGGRVTCVACFTVNAGPAATSFTPAQRGQGLSGQDIDVAGSGFTGGTTVAFSGTGITVNSVTHTSSTAMTVNVDVAGGAPLGARTATLQNADDGTLTCVACFSVTGPTSVSIAPPAALTDNVVVTFSQPVSGVSASNVYVRITGTATTVSAGISCTDATSVTADCATGSVRHAIIDPSGALVSGQNYTVYVAPGGSPSITDFGGLTVDPATRAFRASTVEQAETSAGAAYSWRTVSTSSAYGGSYVVEHLNGARAIFRFMGTSATWYTNTGPSYGLAYVYVDGHSKGTFNQYSSHSHYRVARTISGLSSGAHALTVIVRGLKGSSSGTGSNVAVDAFTVGGVRQNSPSLTTSWAKISTSHASGHMYVEADLLGETVNFSFRGTRVDWYTVLGSSMGRARVYIDGVLKGTFDNYSSSTHYLYDRSFRGLSDGVHTIKIRVLGTHRSASHGSLIAVDRWVVV